LPILDPQRLVVLWPWVTIQGYKSKQNESGWIKWSSKQFQAVGTQSREMVEAQMSKIDTKMGAVANHNIPSNGKSATNVN
jgi:hypothetical protein